MIHGVAAHGEEDRRQAGEEEGDALHGMAPRVKDGEDHQGEAEPQMQEHVGHIEDTGLGEGGDVSAVDN